MTDQRHDREDSGTPRIAGAAAGGLGGAVAGAAMGTITGGPIGTIIGAIAGAVGGGWVGLAAGGAVRHYDMTHDETYRAHYESSPDRLADRSFEQIRPAYQLGHLAASNADYLGLDFDDIEPELQRGWLEELRRTHGEWEAARRFAHHAFERVRSHESTARSEFGTVPHDGPSLDIGETPTHQRPSFSDPIAPGDPDHVLGA